MTDTLFVSNVNYKTLLGSTITASTMTISSITVSTMTASTIFSATGQTALGNNVSYPNRFVEVGSDTANSIYLDFHSSDAALPDYSTRIQSLGGATSGTGNLNMYASTIGLMPTVGVGIGVTVPSASLHIKNAASAMRISGNLTNTSTRPAVSITPGAFEIRGSGIYDASDDGFLRLSAGGGSANIQSYIELSGYSTLPDMLENIVFGTQGTERMRITYDGKVGIGTTNPLGLLSIYSTFTQTGIWPADGVTFMTTNGTASWSLGKIIGYVYANAGTANGYPGGLAFQTKNTDGLNGTITTKMLIDANGNVGIGTTNPNATLHVNGVVRGGLFYSMGSVVVSLASATNATSNPIPIGSIGVYLVTVTGFDGTNYRKLVGTAIVSMYFDGGTFYTSSMNVLSSFYMTFVSIANNGTITFNHTTGAPTTVYLNALCLG